MSSDDSPLLFETYKLHAELAERAASLREDLNKLYSGMVTGIIAASVIVHRLVPETEMVWVLPALGIVVSLSWMLSLHSVTGRLSAKHNVLVTLEAELPFDFLRREDEEFDKCRFFRRKWTGLLMPWAFMILCAAWLAVLVLKQDTDRTELCSVVSHLVTIDHRWETNNAQCVYQLSS